ncbi:MAG TPA: hypothetical protein VGF70_15320 [Solirubrobacteraceae bacterium]|jgi:hypothetical protein
MSAQVPFSRGVATAATWPLGLAWTSWSYLWRILPVHRTDENGSLPEDLPPALPEGVSDEDIQEPSEGFGPLLHRVYTCAVVDASCSSEHLLRRLSADPDRVAPWRLARFRETLGPAGVMTAGDELLVHMPGPCDGPVRVVDVRPDRFRLATLAGHLEAGQIERRVCAADRGICFAVESWARGGDRFSAFMHDRLRMAKEVQLYMWTSVAERVAREAGGRLLDGVSVHTRRVPPEAFPS